MTLGDVHHPKALMILKCDKQAKARKESEGGKHFSIVHPFLGMWTLFIYSLQFSHYDLPWKLCVTMYRVKMFVLFCFFQIIQSQTTNYWDAEEKRYSCHRVDRVTLDSTHHCLAPKRYSSTPRYPKGYAKHHTSLAISELKWVLEPNTALQVLDKRLFMWRHSSAMTTSSSTTQ